MSRSTQFQYLHCTAELFCYNAFDSNAIRADKVHILRIAIGMFGSKQSSANCLASVLLEGGFDLFRTNRSLTCFQLKNLTLANSDEQQHLVEALIGMEKVAEHINEMQRIHEEYGAIFDHLFRQHQKASKQVMDLRHETSFYFSSGRIRLCCRCRLK